MSEHILISPVGFSPGAVSGVYFALTKQSIQVNQVITVGTRHDDVRKATGTLKALFRKVDGLAYKDCYIYEKELNQKASGPFAARMGLYISQARQVGKTVHVAVTGGRSGMGALAALAAQIYRADRLYHMWVREDIEREGARPNQPPTSDNPYLNPVIAGKDAWELVHLPFADLSGLLEDAEKYRASGRFTENWTAGRLVDQGPAMLNVLASYVPAGLTIQATQELLTLTAEWREKVEWVSPRDPTQKVIHGKIALAAQEAIWQRVLAILYSSGMADDESLKTFRDLWKDSVSDAYVQRKLAEAMEHDDTERLKQAWKENQKTILDLIKTSVAVATLVLKVCFPLLCWV